MKIEDIKNVRSELIVTFEDWVDYYSFWSCFEYRWEKDDGDEHLMAWVNFNCLKSLMEFFGDDTIDECPDDFECIVRHDCVCFPHFEFALEHLDINEEEIKQIFE